MTNNIVPKRLVHILLLSFLLLFSVMVATAANPPEPTYESPTTVAVDGSIGEWNLTNDFFADMYRAGNPDNDVLAKAYLSYDCLDGTLYVLVLTEPGVVIDTIRTQEHYVDINGGGKEVDDTSGNDGIPPDFEFYLDNGTEVGWEASLSLAEGSYALNIHTQVIDAAGQVDQTAAVANRDIDLLLQCPRDRGDLPDDPYATLNANNGATHIISSATYLGSCVDGELDGQQTSSATGDDTGASSFTEGTCVSPNDDEDGVTAGAGSGSSGQWQDGANGGSVNVVGTSGACLNAWMDFNADGDFDDVNEQIATNVSTTGSTQNIAFTIPAGTFSNNPGDPNVALYARFRITAACDDYSAGSAGPGGAASNGEVEDYLFEFRPTAIGFDGLTAGTSSIVWVLALTVVLAGIATAFVAVRARRA